MRIIPRVLGSLLLTSLCSPAIFAQMPAVPADPHELVTRDAKLLTSPRDRNAAIDLLERARQNNNLNTLGAPYTMKASFTSSGQSLVEGDGTMEETSLGSVRRWSAQIGELKQFRIIENNQVYGTSVAEPVPLRVQMARAALLWPVPHRVGGMMIRSAKVNENGNDLSCLLLSGEAPSSPGPRTWFETEYCIDPATALLRMWSEAPGIYVEYDYTGATDFHGHTPAREINVFENGGLTLQVHLDSLGDPGEVDPNLFKVTPEMTENLDGGSYMLSGPERFPMRVDPSNGETTSVIQPVIVHATLDSQYGKVIEEEALQNSDPELTRSALDLVKDWTFEATGFQREVFVNVQFHMPTTYAIAATIRPTIRWAVLEPRRVRTGRQEPRPARESVE
ncbi:MAG: hypothetical protein WA755_18065 [Candidatus Acidiferrales bacterium]